MIYMVDYENVPNTGLNGIDKLTESDKVIIFLKENNTFKAKTHVMLEQSVVKKDYIFVDASTPNALDFQLVAYLGMLCEKNSNDHYVIISKDQGYDAAIAFLKNRGKTVSRETDLAMNTTLKDVDRLLPDLSASDKKKIVNVIENYKTKQAINNNIVKIFGSDKTGTIYKKIKPLLKDKN